MTLRHSIVLAALPVLLPVLALLPTPAEAAQEVEEAKPAQAFTLDLVYKADLMGVAAGPFARGARALDNLDVMAAVDLDRAAGLRGASAYVGILNNMGGRPNDIAGTLQGVNNIEVGKADFLLYQAWVQQRFAGDRFSVLVGKYDLNSEFYTNAAATPLIAPAFGIGSELASTGPNGPSIFPRTDLAVRLRMEEGRHYVQAAAVRAPRGTTDTGGRRSTLLIAEAGLTGRTAISVGGWTYTQRQPQVAPPGVTLAPDVATSHGLYAIVEQDLVGEDDRPGHWRAFLRAGLSDGRTTPFGDGLQVGVTGYGLLPRRPDSLLSMGLATAGLSRPYRRGNPPDEARLSRSESMVELTFSDRIAPFLTLQPDIQYVRNPGGLRDAPDAWVFGLRAIVDWKVR